MEKRKEKFTALEKEIIGVLASARKPITTYHVAEKANTTRLTAKKYLLKLMKEGVVVGKEYTGSEFKKGLYWWLKYG